MRVKPDLNSLRYLFLAILIVFGFITIMAAGGGCGGGDNDNSDNNSCDYDEDIVCENTISSTTGEPCEKFCSKHNGEPGDFIIFNNKLIFSAYEGCANTVRHKLFETDNSGGVKEISEIGFVEEKLIVNNALYFIQNGYLSKYDGSNSPQKIFPMSSNSFNTIKNLMAYNDKIYFDYYNDGSESFSLYSYDGVNAPAFVDDIISSGEYIVYHGKLYFWGYIGNDSNTELWSMDDNTSKPHLVADINPSGSSMIAPAYSNIVIFQDKMFFSATDGVHGGQLWMIDGENPPVMVTNLSKIEYSWGTGDSWIRLAAIFQDKLLCEVEQEVDSQYYKRLYEYDGINPLEPLPVQASYDSHMWLYASHDINTHVVFNNHFYFLAEDTSGGFNFLWDYDGENAPVKINTEDYILDIYPDTGKLLLQGSNKIFSYDSEANLEVFVDLSNAGLSISQYDPTVLFNNNYFIAGYSESYGRELWKIDSTGKAGLVKDYYPGTTCYCDCMD